MQPHQALIMFGKQESLAGQAGCADPDEVKLFGFGKFDRVEKFIAGNSSSASFGEMQSRMQSRMQPAPKAHTRPR